MLLYPFCALFIIGLLLGIVTLIVLLKYKIIKTLKSSLKSPQFQEKNIVFNSVSYPFSLYLRKTHTIKNLKTEIIQHQMLLFCELKKKNPGSISDSWKVKNLPTLQTSRYTDFRSCLSPSSHLDTVITKPGIIIHSWTEYVT